MRLKSLRTGGDIFVCGMWMHSVRSRRDDSTISGIIVNFAHVYRIMMTRSRTDVHRKRLAHTVYKRAMLPHTMYTGFTSEPI